MRTKITLGILSLAGLLGILYLCIAGYQLIAHPLPKLEIHGNIYPEAINLPAFSLEQDQKNIFDDRKLFGHWSMIYFGYTHCPDICPTSLQILNETSTKLAHLPKSMQPQIIFISVDPERDQFPQLDEYIHYFNPDFIALRGNPPTLQTLAKSFGVIFQKVLDNNADPQNYAMQHSSQIFLINPRGQLVASFSAPHQAAQLATDYQQLALSAGS